jgi:ribonuclease VapC
LIAVDSSALVAIAAEEPDWRRYLEPLLDSSDGGVITPINYVETGVILVRRGFVPSHRQFDQWLSSIDVAVDEGRALGSSALAAYLRYGKGVHPARLNLADCFAYALAKQLDAPLLYKGDDFARTDVRSALQPT